MAAKKKTARKKASGLTQLGKGSSIPTSPEKAKIEAFPDPCPDRDYWIHLDCPEFTSVCPITGQPDFAHISIDYIPDKKCVESKSLKLYLFSFRNHGAFSEAIVNRILDDLVEVCKPKEMVVSGEFTPRGGIGITVEAEYVKRNT